MSLVVSLFLYVVISLFMYLCISLLRPFFLPFVLSRCRYLFIYLGSLYSSLFLHGVRYFFISLVRS